MKKICAVVMLLASCFGVSSCDSHVPRTGNMPPITLGPDAFTIDPEKPDTATIASASVSLQKFFQSIRDESSDMKPGTVLDYERLEEDYSSSLSTIHRPSISDDETVTVISEYIDYVATVPESGYVGIEPKGLFISEDGTIQITGEDLFVVYKDGSGYITQKGASLISVESLNDVFTLSEIDGEWKLTAVTL